MNQAVKTLFACRRQHLESIAQAFADCDTDRAKALSLTLRKINDKLAAHGVHPKCLPIGLLLPSERGRTKAAVKRLKRGIRQACEPSTLAI